MNEYVKWYTNETKQTGKKNKKEKAKAKLCVGEQNELDAKENAIKEMLSVMCGD